MKNIKKILVANRGEIALRIIRTCKDMGIGTVAVYSDADRKALHVRMADEAVHLGPAPSSQSYLQGAKVIAAAKATGADAIHPGYGFLSENAEFAEAVAAAGIIFIGPSAHSIRVMGDKLAAKEAVGARNIPMVPGTDGAVNDVPTALKIASKIGLPVLIKASAGGGGKGMRIVEDLADLPEQMERAISEATSAFGNGAVFIEKYITSPKHIEMQIIADQLGNTVHLFERECSIQRRHQKVIEEAPSAVITPEIREAMGKSAVEVAKACGYYGAGTVEFIVDEDLNFFFLEMNTRLQVEHPVTEQITGVDLVREQIRVAEGKPLSFRQEDLKILGHSVEVRVYAENPEEGFLPDTGKLETYQPPKGPGVRVDDGMEEGMEISIYYDPMIAKLTTYGANRQEAIQRMLRAIDEYQITGVKTTLPFCQFALQHPSFLDGSFTTKFVGEFFKPEVLANQFTDDEKMLLAGLAPGFIGQNKASTSEVSLKTKTSKWKQRAR